MLVAMSPKKFLPRAVKDDHADHEIHESQEDGKNSRIIHSFYLFVVNYVHVLLEGYNKKSITNCLTRLSPCESEEGGSSM
jgi:hypothetical protein